MAGSNDVRQQIQALRLPLIIAVVAGIFFTIPDQTKEIYRALAQSFASLVLGEELERELILREVGIAVLGFLILSTVLWLAARRAASRYQARAGTETGPPGVPDFAQRPWPLIWLPRLIAISPLLFGACGVYLASISAETNADLQKALEPVFVNGYLRILGEELRADAVELGQGSIKELMAYNWYMMLAASALLAIALVFLLLLALIDRQRLAALLHAYEHRPGYIAPVVTLAALTAITAAIIASPVALPQSLGALFIMSVFFSFLLLMLAQLQIWGRRLGFPLTASLILAAIFFATLDWNNNHPIRTPDRASTSSPAHLDVTQALKRWLASRRNLDRYADGKRFPLYIVAAQGGGIYAAKHASSFLGELQDLCPGFAHHLFAISSVSGGSVGAAVFAGLVQQYDWSNTPDDQRYSCVAKLEGEREEHFQHATTEIFSKDLWSPLAAGLLFPDFLQRFLPLSIPALDRARSLDVAIENAYEDGLDAALFPVADKALHPLSSSFLRHWNPEQFPHTPALLLNTTEVGSGRRRVVSPFSFGSERLSFLPVWSTDRQGNTISHPLDPPLSTAAGLSARFPWITPSAYFYEPYESRSGEALLRKVRLVDGGYFENSGVVTALDLIKDIVGAVRRGEITQKIEINLLVFTSAGFDTAVSAGLTEPMDPIRTMFNSRAARAGIAIEDAVAALKEMSSEDGPVKADIVKLELNGYGYPLPLGWRLSPITRHLISLHNGVAADCTDTGSTATGESTVVSASCAKRRIYDRLR